MVRTQNYTPGTSSAASLEIQTPGCRSSHSHDSGQSALQRASSVRKKLAKNNMGFWLLVWRLLPQSLCFKQVRTATNSTLRNLWAWSLVSGITLTRVYLWSVPARPPHYNSCLSTTARDKGATRGRSLRTEPTATEWDKLIKPETSPALPQM